MAAFWIFFTFHPMQKNYILTPETAARKLRRMAYEILENNFGEKQFVLAGIRENGLAIAKQLQHLLKGITGIEPELLSVRINKQQVREISIEQPIPMEGKVVILTDDVSNSGRTLTYALRPFLESDPGKLQTLVLVERSHNTFPVKPDYVGLSVATTLQEHIYVEVAEGQVTGAWLE